MKAYLIDPIKRIVSVVDYNGDYKQINKFIDAEIVKTDLIADRKIILDNWLKISYITYMEKVIKY